MIASVVPFVVAFLLGFNPFADVTGTICLILWSASVFNIGYALGIKKGTWLSQERMREVQEMEVKKWQAAGGT